MCNSLTVPGFDEDRHIEADAAIRPLTEEEYEERAAYDRWVAQLARHQAPLDGCEDAPFEGYEAHLDELDAILDDPTEAQANCEACGNALYGTDGLARVMCACGVWNNIKAPRVPHLRLVAAR